MNRKTTEKKGGGVKARDFGTKDEKIEDTNQGQKNSRILAFFPFFMRPPSSISTFMGVDGLKRRWDGSGDGVRHCARKSVVLELN